MATSDWLSRKRIPTLVGLLILAIGLIGGIFVVRTTNTNTFLPRASPETTPKSVKITNITDSGFTVSWVTDARTPGFVRYGTAANALNNTFADDRDQISGTVGQFKTHHVSLKGLKPNTTYYYRLATGTRELYDDNGKPYQTTTTGTISPGNKTIYGSVKLPSGQAASGAIVYIDSAGVAPLSTVVQNSGSWVVSLAQARSKDLKGPASVQDATPFTLLAVSATDNTTSNVSITLSDAQPVPDITLGQNTFAAGTITQTTGSSPTPSPIPAEQLSSKFTSQLLAPPTEVIDASTPLSITYPVQNELVTAARPEFRGKSAPNTKITLSLSGTTKTNGTSTSNASGVWTWTPPAALKNGLYTLSATATIENQAQTATAGFTLDTTKAGTPSLVATGSAQATSTPIASSTAKPVATQEPIATDTPQPVSGSLTPTILLIVAGIGSVAIGTWITVQQAREIPERS